MQAILVALRKESVDRNADVVSVQYRRQRSLSARRAWIEMSVGLDLVGQMERRSPQGERG